MATYENEIEDKRNVCGGDLPPAHFLYGTYQEPLEPNDQQPEMEVEVRGSGDMFDVSSKNRTDELADEDGVLDNVDFTNPPPRFAPELAGIPCHDAQSTSVTTTDRTLVERPSDTSSTRTTESRMDTNLILQRAWLKLRKTQKYCPRDELRKIASKKAVHNGLVGALPHIGQKEIVQLVNQIVPEPKVEEDCAVGLRRIFVILAMIGKVATIIDFARSGLCDADLPLRKAKPSGLCRQADHASTPFHFTTHWTHPKINHFLTWQWRVLSPYFAQCPIPKRVWHYVLSPRQILPFEEVTIQSGKTEHHTAGCSVRCVRIHPSHHEFHNRKCPTGYFAVKELVSSSHEAYRREVDMLQKFSGDSHPHLISLFFTYEQNKKFFLVFDWAYCNLKYYWQHIHPKPSPQDLPTIRWAGQQCLGIASGILRLHKYETYDSSDTNLLGPRKILLGHHGDIKEENILCFPVSPHPEDCNKDELCRPDQFNLLLADFGVAAFNEDRTRSLAPDATFNATPSYRAPESDQKKAQGRSYDMWSLAILYLQIVTWLIGGWRMVDVFRRKRKEIDPGWHSLPIDTFFRLDTKKPGHIVKPAVTEFIRGLHRSPQCTDFLHDMLNLIEYKMLVISPGDRIQAMELHTELKRMVEKIYADPAYASASRPWPKGGMS